MVPIQIKHKCHFGRKVINCAITFVHFCNELVAEVDESDGTIDHFAPEVTLVLNLDWDHADQYGDAAKLDAVFLRLFKHTKQKLLLPDSFHLKLQME